MGVYNTFVVEYDVGNLLVYLNQNIIEKDSCLSFDIEMLEKMAKN